jgi:ABC-2 type transport system ATP-binding protein
MSSRQVAVLTAVSKHFGPIVALDAVTLEVERGTLLALLGPNGAGKSTAIAILLGLQRPGAGSARLLGDEPHRVATRRRVGVMMQELGLAPELKVKEHIELVSSYYPSPMPLSEVLAFTQTTALANRPYGKLSGGQKRLVQFAMAICGRPELLFLDEPTVGLDVQARSLVWGTVRELRRAGTSIVLTTHYLEEAEALADRVAVLARGRLVASGTVNEIRAVVDRKRVICQTRLATADLACWPGVESIDRDDRKVRLTVRDAEAVVRRLLITDPEVRDLEVLRAGLAEAFTELTQEAVR